MIVVPGGRPAEQMRRINDLVWESLDNGGRPEPIAFFCECGDDGCYRSVWLTAAEYEARRADPRWNALAPQHPRVRSAPGHRCEVCGYGVARPQPPAWCPMCGVAAWVPEGQPAIAHS